MERSSPEPADGAKPATSGDSQAAGETSKQQSLQSGPIQAGSVRSSWVGHARWLLPYVRRLLPVLLIAYWAALFAATHMPMPKTESQVNDKVLHVGAYAVLAFLLAWVLSPQTKRFAMWCLVVLVCASYGLMDEWLQRSIPSRTADVWDFAADVVGAMLGAAALIVMQHIWRKVLR